jgi:hypothetical protein
MLRAQIKAGRRSGIVWGGQRVDLHRLVFHDRKIDIATTIVLYTDPFPHSLGQQETNGTAQKSSLSGQ